MSRFKLGDYAAIAEVIGTAGVIVSLVFVAFSINSNTEEARASQTNYIFDASREIELAVATDHDWSRIVVKGRNRSQPLSETEQFRYDAYLVANIDLWDWMADRHRDALMSDVNLDGWERYFVGWTKSHISESDWQRLRWQFDGDPIAQVVQDVISANSVK